MPHETEDETGHLRGQSREKEISWDALEMQLRKETWEVGDRRE